MSGEAGSNAIDARTAPFTYKHLVAHDADQHAQNLGAWEQTCDQLTPGRFQGDLTEAWLSGIQIFRAMTNQVVLQTGKSWAGGRTFGVMLGMDGEGTFCGHRLPRDGAVALAQSGRFSLLTPRRLDVVGIALSSEPRDAYGQTWRRSSADADGMVVGSSRALDRVRCLLRAFFAAAADECTPFHEREAQRSFLGSLLAALAASFEQGVSEKHQPDFPRVHRQLVERAKAYVLAHLDRPVTVAELCSVLGHSRRNLQYCFQTALGVSPVQYLRAVRLNGVHRELRRGDTELRIGDVAARWGFWHQSQFAADYRTLFGELPSATLRRRIPRAVV